jgi:cysteinyl-tRNA synthetase
MPLRVHNTLTRSLEEFTPIHPGTVGMYVCGPTVYGHSHLGHAKSYVSFDVIVRYLRARGLSVRYVQNITDVGHMLGDANDGEDRILRQGKLEQKHPMEIAEAYTYSFFQDMDALNVLRPDISPRATGHIPEQIELIQELIRKGLAYEAGGSVYFAVGAFPAYGRLSGRTVEELEAGARVEVKSEKRHPADFALWKRAEPEHIMRWNSPWGAGFPGWHVECSAMSMKYLGKSFDIHGGGLENQFPHHECEIAQSEGASGHPFVRYWLHNNMVTVNGQKMGKSLGNFTTLKDAFSRWRPEVVRFFILQSHYRSTLDFSAEAVEGAARGFERLTATVRLLRERLRTTAAGTTGTGIASAAYRQRFFDAMDEDFNSPQAIAVLFDFTRDLNTILRGELPVSHSALQQADLFVRECAEGILGMLFPDTQAAGGAGLEDGLMNLLIELRKEARAQKLWALSDRIRDELARLAVTLEDAKDGTTWRRNS